VRREARTFGEFDPAAADEGARRIEQGQVRSYRYRGVAHRTLARGDGVAFDAVPTNAS